MIVGRRAPSNSERFLDNVHSAMRLLQVIGRRLTRGRQNNGCRLAGRSTECAPTEASGPCAPHWAQHYEIWEYC